MKRHRKLSWLSIVFITVVAPVVRAQSIPEYFGIYANTSGKLAPLIGGRGTYTPTKQTYSVFDYLSKNVQDANVPVLDGANLQFMVFDADVAQATSSIELYKLPFARYFISRPDSLQQVGSLLNQITNGPNSSPTSTSVQKFVMAKTEGMKIELLQKPVAGQPQMVQLVPAVDLEPGMYGLFAVRVQGGVQNIVVQAFEWKGSTSATATPDCIDLSIIGGFGGMMESQDAAMEHPYLLEKQRFAKCGASGGNAVTQQAMAGRSSTPSSSGPVACTEYAACFQASLSDYRAKDWANAEAGFQGAAKLRPSSGDPWLWLGRIYLQDGRTDVIQDLTGAWNKALSLGTRLMIAACHERTMQPCERGDLALSTNAVEFLASGSRQIFSSQPGAVVPGKVLSNPGAMHIAYSLKVTGKSYSVDFVPASEIWSQCTFNLMVQCPPAGVAQQSILAAYVSQAVEKLANGSLAASATPPAAGNQASGTPPPTAKTSTCSASVDATYMYILSGHLYKTGTQGSGSDQKAYFYDEKGSQVMDPGLLLSLAGAAWTRQNVVLSQDARGGVTRVTDVLGTSKALQAYSTIQNSLAAAMVEAVEATVTDGASLTMAVPNLIKSAAESQISGSPMTLLTLTAQDGLKASQTAYQQMQAVPLPQQDATALNVSDLARIEALYFQARTLELAYEPLAAKLLPQHASDLTSQAVKSAMGEVLAAPGLSPAASVLTLQTLLNLQEGFADVKDAAPALQAFSQGMILGIRLTAADKAGIAKAAGAAAQKCN